MADRFHQRGKVLYSNGDVGEDQTFPASMQYTMDSFQWIYKDTPLLLKSHTEIKNNMQSNTIQIIHQIKLV